MNYNTYSFSLSLTCNYATFNNILLKHVKYASFSQGKLKDVQMYIYSHPSNRDHWKQMILWRHSFSREDHGSEVKDRCRSGVSPCVNQCETKCSHTGSNQSPVRPETTALMAICCTTSCVPYSTLSDVCCYAYYRGLSLKK